MEQEIKDVIESKLPATVGEVLRKRLEQADIDAAEVERLKKIIGDNVAFCEAQGKKLQQAEAELRGHAALAEREAAVTKREQSIELEIAKCRADNAEYNTGKLFDLVGLVFKSPVVKESTMKTIAVPGSGTNMGYTMPVSETTTREVE